MRREEPTPPSPLPEGKGGENNPSPTPPLNGEGLKTVVGSVPPSFLGKGVRGLGSPLLFLLLLALPACAPKPGTSTADAEVKTVPVTVADAKPMSLRRTVSVVGTLYPYEDVTLSPKVGGRVIRAFKDVGDRVGPGEPLLELDDTEYRLAVDQARPAFEAELRKLKLTTLPATDAAFEQWLPRVDAVAEAKANAELAESELKRAEREMASGVGSRQILDSASNRLTVAKTRVQVAETDARVTLANARRLKAALDDAERKLNDTKLNAPNPPEWSAWLKELGPTTTPLKYAIAQKMVSIGSPVESMPATSCYRLVIDHALKFGVTIPEKHAPEVIVGQNVELKVEAYPNQTFAGFVARISPTTDTSNRTFGVVIGVRNGDGRLKAGGFATGEIVVRSDTVVTIPPEALVQFAGVNKVFVVDGNKVKAVEVGIGVRDKDWLEVTGLPAGAKVVVTGQSQLVDGTPIRVR
ncbi:Multidrug resistance protein MdtE precursor [Gemmata sp. SH-PL17]|uniref:efflux RND transporter periplasmic adaptor subunit n=1 Tax=Gemmata sp. SH-PL17 TaxID=1630693 RepID=UPI00078CA5B7|nr:efflux RND transporter periplasmic adaptor subunit [Gemmata sp. SH-PL17]AMV29743.1 Multidrug resistance protein MdtE precursor [Gemmata sp. SH-PL17]